MQHILDNAYNEKTIREEDGAVLSFLSTLDKAPIYSWLEAGAGLGRFPKKIRDDKPIRTNITCVDINKNLVNILTSSGLRALEASVEKLPFPDNSFDIIHASHIIEHFGFPQISRVLDELFRVIKKGGVVIIRSPLMYPGFWNDIDHVRPYPPKCILQYFEHAQQQIKGSSSIRLEKEWIRHEALQINSVNLPGKIAWAINRMLKKSWTLMQFPKSKANGYVAIFKKI